MLDKRVIVVGSTPGIGASIVAALAADGAEVASIGTSVGEGSAVAVTMVARGPGVVRFYHCDITDRASVRSAFASAVAAMGRLDALVHIAEEHSAGAAEDETDETWDRLMAVNARGTFYTNQEAFPYLKQNGGRIINLGSKSGVDGTPDSAAYSASKGAVTAWTRALARAWGRYNIAVNMVAPAIWTPSYDAYRSQLSADELERHDKTLAQQIPLGGRLGNPDRDLAPVIAFLVSDAARFITGQTIPVDGGLLMVR